MKTIQIDNGKTVSTDCKLFGTGKGSASRPGCKSCAAKFGDVFRACTAAVAAAASTKNASKKTDAKPSRVAGFWGYAAGSFTDIFCNAICERPMTMNQAAAIIDPKSGLPIGPHPKCKKRLIGENLAAFDGHLIYMRVYPKGHAEAGKLTPAAKMVREKGKGTAAATTEKAA
jgi:hypothetical protein